MTDLEINEAIAAHVGWKSRTVIVHHSVGYQWDESLTVWTSPEGRDDVPPSYTTDLNAMREAEEILTDKRTDYSIAVWKLCHLPETRAEWVDFYLIHASARRRAEAFLMTVGKWKGSKP